MGIRKHSKVIGLPVVCTVCECVCVGVGANLQYTDYTKVMDFFIFKTQVS